MNEPSIYESQIAAPAGGSCSDKRELEQLDGILLPAPGSSYYADPTHSDLEME